MSKLYCVVPENIHTFPKEGIFSNTSPPLWKFQLSFIHFLKFCCLIEPPTPPGNSNPFYGGSMEPHI